MRLAVYGYSALLIAFMYLGVVSQSRPGTMTWGPTVDFWAAAIAISHIEHGLAGGLGYRTISYELARGLTLTGNDFSVHDKVTRTLVKRPDRVENAFRAAARLPRSALQDGPIESGAFVTTWAEDIGYADFYELAFRLFGYHALSTYWMFFSILVLSFILFAIAYADDDVATAALGLAVAALFLVGTADIFNDFVPSPAANRYLATLTLIPFMHLLFAGLDRRRMNAIRLGVLLVQAVLYGLTITFRTPAIWTAVGAIVILSAVGIAKFFHARADKSTVSSTKLLLPIYSDFPWRQTALVGLIASAAFAFSSLREMQLHPVYFDEAMPHHLRWHSAIVALAVHPQWPKHKTSPDLPDELGDMIAFKMFENYMRDHRPGEPIISSKVQNLYLARLHDSTMRMKFLEFVRAHPRYAFELYFYYKPKLVISHLTEMFVTISLSAWLTLVPAVLLAFILLSSSGVSLIGMIGIAFAIWVSSLLPVIWAYSGVHVLGERLWSSIVLISVLGIAALTAIARHRATTLVLHK